jgi:hypothetical protein
VRESERERRRKGRRRRRKRRKEKEKEKEKKKEKSSVEDISQIFIRLGKSLIENLNKFFQVNSMSPKRKTKSKQTNKQTHKASQCSNAETYQRNGSNFKPAKRKT